MPGMQRPLQLILARNLLASLHTPAFLVDAGGEIAFYNEVAGTLLGRRFEETGPMKAADWTAAFGPFDEDGKPYRYDQLGLTQALRGDRAAHASYTIHGAGGTEHAIEVSAVPIQGENSFHGAMVFFWPTDTEPV
jgi:PAS domain-containing protein